MTGGIRGLIRGANQWGSVLRLEPSPCDLTIGDTFVIEGVFQRPTDARPEPPYQPFVVTQVQRHDEDVRITIHPALIPAGPEQTVMAATINGASLLPPTHRWVTDVTTVDRVRTMVRAYRDRGWLDGRERVSE